jgi:hypothetical protein
VTQIELAVTQIERAATQKERAASRRTCNAWLKRHLDAQSDQKDAMASIYERPPFYKGEKKQDDNNTLSEVYKLQSNNPQNKSRVEIHKDNGGCSIKFTVDKTISEFNKGAEKCATTLAPPPLPSPPHCRCRQADAAAVSCCCLLLLFCVRRLVVASTPLPLVLSRLLSNVVLLTTSSSSSFMFAGWLFHQRLPQAS